jgi:hypothetical protein
MKWSVIAGSLLLLPWAAFAQGPEIFPTPEAAAKALIQAAQQNNSVEMTAIFGQQGWGMLSSGNAAQDQAEVREFAQAAQVKYQLETDSTNPNRVYLSLGSEDWPFPAPIVKTRGGWIFDPALGASENKMRRVGADEMDAIEICSGFVNAQLQYAGEARDEHGIQEYAERIMSSPGKHDGLYWDGAAQPLVPRGFAEADASNGNPNPKPYHGYLFKVLSAQGPDANGGPYQYVVNGMMFGGFGLVAWPAQYGVTGIHTFIVNQNGTVFEKDLGAQTPTLAPAIRAYNPDFSWTEVNE